MRARYVVWGDSPDNNPWYDLAEAEPRSRARLIDDRPFTIDQATVIVNDDGTLTYDSGYVEVQPYNPEELT